MNVFDLVRFETVTIPIEKKPLTLIGALTLANIETEQEFKAVTQIIRRSNNEVIATADSEDQAFQLAYQLLG